MSALEHLRRLTSYSPRGSGERGEAQAAEYAAKALREAGLDPSVERFKSAKSAWHPYTAFAAMALISVAVFQAVTLPRGAFSVLCLTLVALCLGLLELAFLPNPLRWLLDRVGSQNVVARIAPQGPVRARVVLLGHLDTHRTPLVFSTDGWVRFFEKLIPLGLASVVVLAVLQALVALGVNGPWQLLSIPSGVVAAVLVILTLQADLTAHTEGANDNASGAAVVLDLASRLRAAPLAGTEVWTVLTGCEEVGCYGAAAFAKAHHADLTGAAWMPIDSVAGRGARPCYLLKETFLLATRSDPGLVRLADRLAARRPELGLRPATMGGAYTEGWVGGRHGFRVLTFLAFDSRDLLPEWHRTSDVIEKADPEVMTRTEDAVWELLHDLDAEAGGAAADAG